MPHPIPNSECFDNPSRIITAAAIIVSVLQGISFGKTDYTAMRNIAVSFSILNLIAALAFQATGRLRYLGVTLVLYGTQFGLFLIDLFGTESSAAPRLLQIAVILTHTTVLLSAALLSLRFFRPLVSILICVCFSSAVFVWEALSDEPPNNLSSSVEIQWSEEISSHPELGFIYRPYSNSKTIYPANPRNYFLAEDRREKIWWVRAEGNNHATLIFPSDRPEVTRLEINHSATEKAYDIQLNLPKLKVNKGNHLLMFRARADKPRMIYVGLAMAHPPWQGLGLYQQLALTPEWQEVQERFQTTTVDENARIHFDVGGDAASIEVSSVILFSMPERKPIYPEATAPLFYVNYRFNGKGCRGPDYIIPKPADTFRILTLGDSAAMGAGVHESDTFTNRLEILIRKTLAASTKRVEVMNCGVRGYDLEQQATFYKLSLAAYEPNLVLLVLPPFSNPQMPSGRVIGPDKLYSLFSLLGKPRTVADRPAPASFSDELHHILRLHQYVQRNHARLAVILLRPDTADAWRTEHGRVWKSTAGLIDALRAANISILDTAKSFGSDYNRLVVYPGSDWHPNEIAHELVAQEVLKFLKKEQFFSQNQMFDTAL